MDLIKDDETVINVSDLINSLEKHKEKELMIHIWIKGKKDKFLVGNPSIYGGTDGDNTFNLTITFNEKELEEDD